MKNELDLRRRTFSIESLMFIRMIVLLSMVLPSGCRRSESSHLPVPDILLVSIDTLRADHLGAYGSPNGCTPFLDRMAQSGSLVRRTVSVIPQTTCSHATMLTGLLPHHHGSRDNAIPVRSGTQTVADVLKKVGYHTAGFVSHFLLSPDYSGLQTGFDVYDAPPVPEYLKTKPDNKKAFPLFPNDYRKAEVITGKATRWLQQASEPFFLFVHYYDCHIPYRPAVPYRKMERLDLYDRELASVDRAVEKLIRVALMAGNRPLVVHITADHGESMGEHGYRGHGKYIYFPSVIVPWVRWTSNRSGDGRIIDTLVGNAAIAPALAEEAGCTLPGSDGNAVFKPGTNDWSKMTLKAPAYSESASHWPKEQGRRIRSMRDGNYVLILGEAGGIRELYDIRTDPGEMKNRFDDPALKMIRRSLTDDLHRLIRDDTISAPDPRDVLDPKVQSALKALGYLSDDLGGERGRSQ